MKKTVAFILSAVLLLGFASCSQKSDKVKEAENTTADTSYSEITESSVSETEAHDTDKKATADGTTTALEPLSGEGLSVYTESFASGQCSVSISYPRYAGTEHELFNISVRNHAMQKYNSSGMMPEDDALYEIVSCDIMYESDILVSAVITGHIINNTAAHDSYFAYTLNADPQTGRIYMSDELVGDLDLIKSGIADNSFTQSFGISGIFEEINPNDITLGWRSEYGVFPDMYFTEESFGVLAEVPNVLGGYAGFEIPYGNMGDMVNDTAKILCAVIIVD